jgi:class 3 adenylate cyclase
MDRFFQILSDGVHRFEGIVDKFTGDGIMAIFGAPIAHEDHARRACYAALYLKEELRRYAEELKRTRELSFAVRMASTRVRSSSERSATISRWSTRPTATPWALASGWSSSPRPIRST